MSNNQSTQQVRVCMVIDDFYPDVGGAQIYTQRLAQSLVHRGHKVTVITRQLPSTKEYEELDGLPIYRVPYKRGKGKAIASISFTIAAIKKLYKTAADYDIIHSHKVISPATIGLLSRELLGKKLLIQPHSSSLAGALADMIYNRPITGPIRLKWMRYRADCVVAISQQVLSDIKRIGVSDNKISFIPNGVDTNKFSPIPIDAQSLVRKALDLPTNIIVTFVGRLDEVKQVDVLLRAWKSLQEMKIQAHLLIIGDGPERKRLQALTQCLQIDSTVQFLGSKKNIAEYLQVSNVFVMPSRAESLGIALLEAMACGIPCIASSVGGMRDIIQDMSNGLLVSSGNTSELTHQLSVLINDSELRSRLGCAGRIEIINRFSLDTATDSFITTYKAIIEGRSFNFDVNRALDTNV